MKFRYYQKPGKDSQIYKICFKSCSIVYHFIALWPEHSLSGPARFAILGVLVFTSSMLKTPKGFLLKRLNNDLKCILRPWFSFLSYDNFRPPSSPPLQATLIIKYLFQWNKYTKYHCIYHDFSNVEAGILRWISVELDE